MTLNGENPLTLECSTPYAEPGVTVSDTGDANPTLSISGSVDSSTPGEYTITYTATDASGNEAQAARTVNVVDTTPPTITLEGDNPLTLECPIDSYNEPGATASDICDANPTLSISGSVDSSTLGDYTITYTATDASGQYCH